MEELTHKLERDEDGPQSHEYEVIVSNRKGDKTERVKADILEDDKVESHKNEQNVCNRKDNLNEQVKAEIPTEVLTARFYCRNRMRTIRSKMAHYNRMKIKTIEEYKHVIRVPIEISAFTEFKELESIGNLNKEGAGRVSFDENEYATILTVKCEEERANKILTDIITLGKNAMARCMAQEEEKWATLS